MKTTINLAQSVRANAQRQHSENQDLTRTRARNFIISELRSHFYDIQSDFRNKKFLPNYAYSKRATFLRIPPRLHPSGKVLVTSILTELGFTEIHSDYYGNPPMESYFWYDMCIPDLQEGCPASFAQQLYIDHVAAMKEIRHAIAEHYCRIVAEKLPPSSTTFAQEFVKCLQEGSFTTDDCSNDDKLTIRVTVPWPDDLKYLLQSEQESEREALFYFVDHLLDESEISPENGFSEPHYWYNTCDVTLILEMSKNND